MQDYDVIILGGGPAGMSALLWCHSLNLRGLLLERKPEMGGQMLEMFHRIIDYPGVSGLTGLGMRDQFLLHLDELKLERRTSCAIEEVRLSERRVRCNGEWLSAHAIIIATGASKRRLGVPGEDRFETIGVSYSATRDHSRYAGKKVAVIGGGDSAIENSLILARVCPQVTLIHRSDTFRARPAWLRAARENPLINFVAGVKVCSIEGSERAERVIIEDLHTLERRAIETEGVFIKIGARPNTEMFCDQLEADEDGYIKVDQRQRTSLAGIYAAGDVCRPVCLSVATAVGQAAIAAKDIALNPVNPVYSL